MGFWSALGKGLGMAGGIAAAPFTGGASLIPTILGGAGAVAGGISAGRAAGRQAEAGHNLDQDALVNRNRLDSARLGLDADQYRTRQLLSADMLQNFKAPTDPRAQQFGGNFNSINPETLNLLRSNAMKAYQTKSDVPQMQQTPTPQSGKMDSFLNLLSGAGQFTDVLNESGAFKKKRPVVPGQTMPISGNVTPPSFY